MPVLKGNIDITDKLEFVQSLITYGGKNPNLMIVNLDEDLELKGENVLGGACLLPPPEAIMAEVDGDIYQFDYIYNTYFDTDWYVIQYMSMLFTYVSNGGSLLFYYPSLDTSESIIVLKFMDLFTNKYGIIMGIAGFRPCSYNLAFSPVILYIMYMNDRIDSKRFLIEFPLNTEIVEDVMFKLIYELKPPEELVVDQKQHIMRLVQLYKENPNCISPIVRILK